MKACTTCLMGLTSSYPDRGRCDECLSEPEKYKHYIEGDPKLRLLRLQRSGEINIVIGGEGEHEVNANWGIDEAYKHLAETCEACGGVAIREGLTQILLMKTYGPSFVLMWMHSKLYSIRIREHTSWWAAR